MPQTARYLPGDRFTMARPDANKAFGQPAAPGNVFDIDGYTVMVRDFKLTTRSMEFIGATGEINNEIDFQAEFESGYRLPNVFFVVEIDGEKGGKSLLVREVGDLAPREPVKIVLRAPLARMRRSLRWIAALAHTPRPLSAFGPALL